MPSTTQKLSQDTLEIPLPPIPPPPQFNDVVDEFVTDADFITSASLKIHRKRTGVLSSNEQHHIRDNKIPRLSDSVTNLPLPHLTNQITKLSQPNQNKPPDID